MSIVVPPILGVTGTDVAPMVKHVPAKGQGFIHSHTNQFFIAGCEAFHSFSLQYPWAFGSVERLHLRNRIQIKARFICLFIQCSLKRQHKFWHGPHAKGGYHYLGIYIKKAPTADELEMEVSSIVKYIELPVEYQNSIADFSFFGSAPNQQVQEMARQSKALSRVGTKRIDSRRMECPITRRTHPI